MSDHLPECLLPDFDKGVWVCCCAQLRACEQRVLLSKPNIELSAVYGYEAGRADGLSAARDAVADLRTWPTALTPANAPIGVHAVVIKDAALAAIDALRGSGNPDTPPSAEKGEQA